MAGYRFPNAFADYFRRVRSDGTRQLRRRRSAAGHCREREVGRLRSWTTASRPARSAWSAAVSPAESTWSRRAPALNRSRTISKWPRDDDAINGVALAASCSSAEIRVGPSPLARSTSAPASTSSRAISASPLVAASSRGLIPKMLASTLAPASTSTRADRASDFGSRTSTCLRRTRTRAIGYPHTRSKD